MGRMSRLHDNTAPHIIFRNYLLFDPFFPCVAMSLDHDHKLDIRLFGLFLHGVHSPIIGPHEWSTVNVSLTLAMALWVRLLVTSLSQVWAVGNPASSERSTLREIALEDARICPRFLFIT
jgi:hypothetical protein